MSPTCVEDRPYSRMTLKATQSPPVQPSGACTTTVVLREHRRFFIKSISWRRSPCRENRRKITMVLQLGPNILQRMCKRVTKITLNDSLAGGEGCSRKQTPCKEQIMAN